MDRMKGTGVVAGPATGAASGPARGTRRVHGVVVTGLVATLVAMALTIVCAALARDAGVDFTVSGSEETIPLSGFAVVTGFFSALGVVIAAACGRWSARPAQRFVRTAVSLTAISFVPPVLSEADAPATAALIGLHLVAATVMIPALARSLRVRTG